MASKLLDMVLTVNHRDATLCCLPHKESKICGIQHFHFQSADTGIAHQGIEDPERNKRRKRSFPQQPTLFQGMRLDPMREEAEYHLLPCHEIRTRSCAPNHRDYGRVLANQSRRS